MKVKAFHISLILIVVLILSNIYQALTYQEQYKDRTNALGESLIQNRVFLSESIRTLNTSLKTSRINFEDLDILYSDLIQLSRQYKVIMFLDGIHREQWSKIKYGIDSVMEFVKDLDQKIQKLELRRLTTHLLIDHEQSIFLEKIKDNLIHIERYMFSINITIGSDPQVIIVEDKLEKAVEASNKLETDSYSAINAFWGLLIARAQGCSPEDGYGVFSALVLPDEGLEVFEVVVEEPRL